MSTETIVQKSATEIVAALASKEVGLRDVLTALASHRAHVNPDINAFDSIAPDNVPRLSGPLHGLPITVKDQIAVAGQPLNFGLDLPGKNVSATTAPVVQKMLDAGAVVIGKTNLPPYAMDFQTNNRRAGRTNNPWNIRLTAGGSSGGGAAAVATGMSFLDIGADLSGSLRLPAAYCGVVSLLPGEGTVQTEGLLPNAARLAHFARPGIIARSVADLELAWAVIADKPRPQQASSTSIRLGVWDFEAGTVPTASAIAPVFSRTFDLLARNGIKISKTSARTLFKPDVYRTFGEIMGYETGALLPPIVRFLVRQTGKRAAERSPRFLKHVHTGYRHKQSLYDNAVASRRHMQNECAAALQNLDALMIPVCGVQPFEHREPDSERNGIRDYVKPFAIGDVQVCYLDAMTAFTVPISVMGNPVVTLALGPDNNGLPVGAQLVGKHGQEWELLAIANSIASRLPGYCNRYLFAG